MWEDDNPGAGDRSVATAGPAADHVREAAAIAALRQDGFTGDFAASDGELQLIGADRRFRPEDCRILNHFRFEGTSDPGDMSIVYALETRDGTRGILVDAFGTYADPEVGAVVSRMTIERPVLRGRHRLATAALVAVGLLIIGATVSLRWARGCHGRSKAGPARPLT
jgi:hypothetical protein